MASAADLVKVWANLGCIGVGEEDFSALVTGSDVTRKKPDPEIFLKAAGKMGIHPGHCIVLEDALSGLRAAKSAGMSSIGITTAFTREEMLGEYPDYVIDDIRKALDLILEWRKSSE